MGILMGLIGIVGGYLLIKYGLMVLIMGSVLVLTALGLKKRS